MKKKVIALVIDTTLTNDQLEESHVVVLCSDKAEEDNGLQHVARNVRVLDSDEIEDNPRKPFAIEMVRSALALMDSMIKSGEKHSDKSLVALGAARTALGRIS